MSSPSVTLNTEHTCDMRPSSSSEEDVTIFVPSKCRLCSNHNVTKTVPEKDAPAASFAGWHGCELAGPVLLETYPDMHAGSVSIGAT
jgi:hypothetical protein